MILSFTGARQQKHIRDGSVLKHLRSIGGGYKGCTAGGITLVISAIFVGVLFLAAGLSAIGIFFGGLFGLPGICLILFGMMGQKRKVNTYMAYYQASTGFDVDEIQQIDREILSPDTVTIGYLSARTRRKEPEIACFITKHYFVMPMLMGNSYIKRIDDMVAAAYSDTIPGINGYKQGLIFLAGSDDSVSYNAELTKDSCMEIIQALSERNPSIFMHQKFMYEGKTYDLLSYYWKEVLRLHKELSGASK